MDAFQMATAFARTQQNHLQLTIRRIAATIQETKRKKKGQIEQDDQQATCGKGLLGSKVDHL
jgi:hypothetical protein